MRVKMLVRVAAAIVIGVSALLVANAQSPDEANNRLLVSLAIDPLHVDPASRDATAALEALGEALAGSFRIAAPSQPAHLRIELSGERLVGGGRGAFPVRSRGGNEVALIRTTVSRGDDLIEVRGRSTEANRPWRSAAAEVARTLRQLLSIPQDTIAGAPVHGVAEDAAPGSQAATPAVLSRVWRYVGNYQQSFASIVADEYYLQEYWQRRLRHPSPLHATRRDLRSEIGFTFFPEASIWFGYRDVLKIDGATVPQRDRELQKLFLDRRVPSREQFKQVAETSARFNIGPAVRNFNVPLTTLLFASPEHRDRCQFQLLRIEQLAGIETAVIAFTETARPTLITRNGHDRPSRGLLWVESASGRILRTDLAINEDALDARLTTWFAHDEHAGMMVPVRMREVYDFSARLDEYLETLATYTNFRRFETTTRIRP